jgi:CheY-like chemotaxis protein
MARGTVLVVDDDPDIVALLISALEAADYKVAATVDGEALRVAHDLRPDLILLDIMMPGMDGVEVCQHLREDPVTEETPIIVMSAQHRLRTTAPLMLVNGRLPKPFDLDRLYATVDRWVKMSS